jgi:hypothetical protein
MVCASAVASVEAEARIILDGSWAEVSVPRCTNGSSGVDEFRLIRFEERWRVVYLELFEEPLSVTAGR